MQQLESFKQEKTNKLKYKEQNCRGYLQNILSVSLTPDHFHTLVHVFSSILKMSFCLNNATFCQLNESNFRLGVHEESFL